MKKKASERMEKKMRDTGMSSFSVIKDNYEGFDGGD